LTWPTANYGAGCENIFALAREGALLGLTTIFHRKTAAIVLDVR
jgi:hypothetical protein